MPTKKCMRSGRCCSSIFALVPKTEDSNLSPAFLDSLADELAFRYIEDNSEPMGAPCHWLVRDEVTTEATCKAHERKGSDCLNYPEYIVGSEWCPVGMAYWKGRQKQGLPIPVWVEDVLKSIK